MYLSILDQHAAGCHIQASPRNARVSRATPYIDTKMSFAPARYRGFRAPNRFTARDEKELKSMGDLRPVRVYNARLLHPPPTLESLVGRAVGQHRRVHLVGFGYVPSPRLGVSHVRGRRDSRDVDRRYRRHTLTFGTTHGFTAGMVAP